MKNISGSNRDTLLAIRISWGVISLVILLVLISPFVLPENTIYKISSFCRSANHTDKGCILCGATNAFVNISRGNFGLAAKSNLLSIFIYIFFVLNEMVFILFLKKNLNKLFYKSK